MPYENAGTPPAKMVAENSPSGDAFGRLRVSEPQAVFEVSFQYDLEPYLMGAQRQDAGTSVAHAPPTATLSVPTTAGRRICYQSHRYLPYQPGKSHLVRITGQLGNGTLLAGMGYGDDNDGIFLERTTTGAQIRFASSTLGTSVVPQAQWNVDALDGSGPSHVTLDMSKAQHLVIDLQWLAVGRVRVGLMIDGRIVYVHYLSFSNVATTAYTRSASLPVRWYAESVGTAGSMTAICAAVASEGGHDPQGRLWSTSTTTAKALLGAGVRTPLVSLRPALLFNALTNRALLLPTHVSAMIATQDNVLVELVQTGTLTGAVFAAVDADSHAEIDTSATAISGGKAVWSDYITAQVRSQIGDSGKFDPRVLPLSLRADGTQDVLTLCATRLGNAVSVYGAFNWMEFH